MREAAKQEREEKISWNNYFQINILTTDHWFFPPFSDSKTTPRWDMTVMTNSIKIIRLLYYAKIRCKNTQRSQKQNKNNIKRAKPV